MVLKAEDLREKYSDLWKKSLEHPFVRELEEGSLPLEKFHYYLKQDYHYLLEYSKAIALLIAKSNNVEELRSYTEILYNTIHIEISHHKNYCKSVGIEGSLRKTETAPTTMAYSQYLLQTAYSGTVPEILSIILPCFWVYLDISKHLETKGTREEYKEWINMYRSEEYRELVNGIRKDFNRYLKHVDGVELGRIETHFKRALQYEYMFWDMAYTQETWPL